MRSGAFQFSIRGVLLSATLLALALAALPYNAWSGFWATTFTTIVCGIFLFAVLSVVFRRGQQQAFWGGFAIAGISYAALVLWVLGTSEKDAVGRLATTQLLRRFESLVQREIFLEQDAKMIEGLSYYFQSNANGALVPATMTPVHEHLMLCGQLLWALLIGYAGGVLARYFYLTREPTKSSPA